MIRLTPFQRQFLRLPLLLICITIWSLFSPLISMATVEKNSQLLSPGDSVQQAIESAPPHSTILLSAGVYAGPIHIDRPLHLKGNGAVITGDGVGHVITIQSDHVQVEGLTIRASGIADRDAGIYAEGSALNLEDLSLSEVKYGIYLENAQDVIVKNNQISSYPDHFSKRGNGIHLANTKGVQISQNRINGVQDGIYLEYAAETSLLENEVENSRYGMHFMFSELAEANHNELHHNIIGFMVMYSQRLSFEQNRIEKQLHFRGYGTMIYEAGEILFQQNQLLQNSNALALENAYEVNVLENQLAGNHTGLILLNSNQKLQIERNQWVGNLLPIRFGTEADSTLLDDSLQENYWDDYTGFDLNQDGIGDSPYYIKSSSGDFISQIPAFQLFFQSPAMQLWNQVNDQFFNPQHSKGIDRQPLMEPELNSHPILDSQHALPSFALSSLQLLILSGTLLIALFALLNWAKKEEFD